MNYEYGPWTGTAIQNWQNSYHDSASNALGNERIVGAYETFDLQGTYSGIKNLKLTLGIKNVFDKDPPYSNAPAQFQSGYDANYGDPRGRFYYAAVTYSFL